MTHLHFIVWAAENQTPNGYSGVTYVDVIETDAKAAVARARELIPNRAFYWINSIVEHHDHSDLVLAREHAHANGQGN